jgi:tRNA threonylcarbamoyladenosine dehydratase
MVTTSGTARGVSSFADRAGFYAALTARNRGLIGDAEQWRLRTSRVLVAGCGSIGGAAVEPLVRLGAENLVLAEPDVYELHNLNRQNATLDDVGKNKALALAARCRAINPHATVEVQPAGVTSATVTELLDDTVLAIDGVDVTTASALACKYLLHVHAHQRQVPVVSGYDIAGVQMVLVYDYRNPRVDVMAGRVGSGAPAILDEPLRFLARVTPLPVLPEEIVPLLRRQLLQRDEGFPQLVYTALLFGVLAPRIALDLLAGRPVRHRIVVDVHQLPRPIRPRWSARARAATAVARLARTARLHRRTP